MPRRLITSELFKNEQVAGLDYAGRYFFIGLITHADDDGRLKGSAKYLKGNIFPYDNITIDQIECYKAQCVELGLIAHYTIDEIEYILFPTWNRHQVIRSDRYKPSVIPVPNDNHLSTNGIPSDNQTDTVGMLNISKDNISKDNISNIVTKKLNKFPPEYINLRKQVFDLLQKRRGYKSRNPGAEALSISQMLQENCTPDDIIKAYDLIKEQPFWQNKCLTMMSVRKDIHDVLKRENGKQGKKYTSTDEYKAKR